MTDLPNQRTSLSHPTEDLGAEAERTARDRLPERRDADHMRDLLPAIEPERRLNDWGRSERVEGAFDKTLVEFFYRYWFRAEVEGVENVPAEGGALLVSNHSGALPPDAAIRKPAKAHGRYKKQTGGGGQFGDCHIEISPNEHGEGFEFENGIKGGVIPGGFIPAVEKGIVEAMSAGVLAGYPMKDVKVRLYDGQHHSVDSSEMAFKICGSMAFKQAVAEADAGTTRADHAR